MTLVLLLLAYAGHVILWVALVNRLHAIHMQRHLLDGLTFAIGLLLIALPIVWLPLLAPLLGYTEDPTDPPSWGWIGWSYFYICIAVLVVATIEHFRRLSHPEKRVTVVSQSIRPLDLQDVQPKQLVRAGLPRWLATLPFNEAAKPVVTEIELAIDNLPADLDGLRIVHLSDLHMSGRFHRRYYELVVDQANQLDADLLALTGDIVEKSECLDWIDTVLAKLTAKHARLFLLGNHDMKVDCQEVRKRFGDAAWIDVSQSQPAFAVGSATCQIVGNESPWFAAPTEIPASPSNAMTLALVHTPDLFTWAANHDFDLLLAGHNHGGQIQFPITGPIVAPSQFGTRYANGLFRRGKTIMHVSPGTGSLAPLRWGCPPQLTLLVLRRVGA